MKALHAFRNNLNFLYHLLHQWEYFILLVFILQKLIVGARDRNNILGHGPYPRTLNYPRRGQ